MTVMLDCVAAERRIRQHVIETPAVRSGPLSALSGAEVYLKLENLQETGSFKPRGATHKLLSLTPAQAARRRVVFIFVPRDRHAGSNLSPQRQVVQVAPPRIERSFARLT